MSLSIRWKVTLAFCSPYSAGLSSLAYSQPDRWQNGNWLNPARPCKSPPTSLRSICVHWSRHPPFRQSLQLQTIVRELSQRARARVTLIDASGRVLADSAVRDGFGGR